MSTSERSSRTDGGTGAVAGGSAPSGSASNRPELNLPKEYFPLPVQSAGFQIPPYLATYEEADKIKPPAVVVTLEKHLAALSPEQSTALATMHETVRGEEWYDSTRDEDDWLLLRYLRARSYNVKKAVAMLANTAKWSKEAWTKETACQACVTNPNQHLMQFVGWDLKHRPTAFMSMRWGQERKHPLQHCVATFNHLISLMPVGVEQWVCISDFVTYSHIKDGNPKMGTSVISTIQDQFPERLGMMICVNPPTMFWVLYKLFSPFIDPVTKEKVQFVYTKSKPNINDVFPKIFPPHLCKYLIENYERAIKNDPPPPLPSAAQ